MSRRLVGEVRTIKDGKWKTQRIEFVVESDTDEGPVGSVEQAKRDEYHRTMLARIARCDELARKFMGLPDATYNNAAPDLRKAIQHIADAELGFPWA